MAGRGRGRGRGGLSFNAESLGIQRGDVVSTTNLQPPPLFPPLQYMPNPLTESSQSQTYVLEVKQEIQVKFQQSPYFMTFDEKKRDIERYSDKYQNNHQEPQDRWKPDYNRFPAELKPRKRKAKGRAVQPNLKTARKMGSAEEVLSKWEQQEKNTPAEGAGDEEDEEDEEKEGQEQAEEEEEEYEDGEEETDYNLTYFDNGENYGDDDDDDDEPVYS